MNNTKESELAITPNEKENIRDRVKKLFKGRSLRQVSLDWGLPYSTLNNYFTRSATPSIDILVKISEIENVSLEWLATGETKNLITDEVHHANDGEQLAFTQRNQEELDTAFTATPMNDEKFMALSWSMFFEALSKKEKSQLIDIFAKIGIKGVLALLNDEREYAEKWLELSQAEQGRLLRLHEQLKKGTSDADRGVAESDLTKSDKKAG